MLRPVPPALSVGSGLTTPPAAPATPAAAPPITQPLRKFARFISTDAVASALKLAEDGKLPELRLHEGQDQKAQQQTSGMNPLVLVGLLCMSVALSIGLWFIDIERASGPSFTQQKRRAWERIEEKFFPRADEDAPLQPYQRYLREARQAGLHGDRKKEQVLLRKVLDMLWAEGGALAARRRAEQEGKLATTDPDRWGPDRTLTGRRLEWDEELEKCITILLRED